MRSFGDKKSPHQLLLRIHLHSFVRHNQSFIVSWRIQSVLLNINLCLFSQQFVIQKDAHNTDYAQSSQGEIISK